MKVMVIVKASPASEAGVMPSQELLTAMGNFNEELVKAGILLSGEGLHPSSRGIRVRFSGEKRTVIDGPFAETKELVAGFWIWQVKDLQEALEWVKRCPNPHADDSEIEIRQFFEAAGGGIRKRAALFPQAAGQADEPLLQFRVAIPQVGNSFFRGGQLGLRAGQLLSQLRLFSRQGLSHQGLLVPLLGQPGSLLMQTIGLVLRGTVSVLRYKVTCRLPADQQGQTASEQTSRRDAHRQAPFRPDRSSQCRCCRPAVFRPL